MEAFRAAYDAGCDMVEFDVQLSRDGVPVVFHDDDGGRLAGRKERVFDLDWKSLREWVLPPGQEGQKYGYRLPTLEDFLAEFGSRAYYLEMKVPRLKQGDKGYWEALGRKCADLVTQSRPRPETFLASFHPGLLEQMGRAQAFPALVGIYEDLERFREVLGSKKKVVQRHSLSWRVYRGYLKSAAPTLGLKVEPSDVLLWDIHGRKDMETALAEGVYALVADDVQTMLEVCRV